MKTGIRSQPSAPCANARELIQPAPSPSPALTRAICALTVREREVLRLRAKGLLYKQIADQMQISAHTVKNHLDSIHHKLGVHNTIEAINAASRIGVSLD